jgi:glycosyltransferase involved in cell wall biosynthesis
LTIASAAPLSVSIALATYNGARYIREQLDDLTAQTHLPAELVVCDDGSTDGTLDIIEQFATTAPFPVRIHRNAERLGYRANFMKCAGLCTSDLIAFCDQDDRWQPQKLERLSTAFADPEVLLAYHNACATNEQGGALSVLYSARRRDPHDYAAAGAPWFNPLGFTQVFRRSLLAFDDLWPQSEGQDGPGERLAHDQWYFWLASVFGSIRYESAVLADYRQHALNTYGISWHRVRSPVLTELWHSTRLARQRAEAAESRVRILEQATKRFDGVWKDRALDGAQHYRRLSEQLAGRADAYDSPTFRSRLAAVRKLRKMHGSRAAVAPMPPVARAMDMIIGVPGLLPTVEQLLSPLATKKR